MASVGLCHYCYLDGCGLRKGGGGGVGVVLSQGRRFCKVCDPLG